MLGVIVIAVVSLMMGIAHGADVSSFLAKPECLHYYTKNAGKAPLRNYTNVKNPNITYILDSTIPYVFEDFCPTNRWQSSYLMHISPEVTVNHKYKFVYVVQRKNGCTEMGRILWTYFRSYAFTCPGNSKAEPACLIKTQSRCTVECLPPYVIDNYFFFTLSRNPISRVYSSLKQISKKKSNIAVLLNYYLKVIANSNCAKDPHFETQSFAMFSPTRNGSLVPMHYVGQLHTMHEDLRLIFGNISQRMGNLRLPDAMVEFLRADPPVEVANTTPKLDKLAFNALMMSRTNSTNNLIRNIYGQDMACLGYDA